MGDKGVNYERYMNTNASMQEVLKQTRRNIFWRLYTLPWILLTLLLACVLYFTYTHKPKPTDYYDKYTNLVIHANALETQMTQMREAAMLTGNGKWITSPSGSNQFVYTENTNMWDYNRIYEKWNEQLTNMAPIYESQKAIIQELFKLHGNLSGVAKALGMELGKVEGVILKEEVIEDIPLPPMPKNPFGGVLTPIKPVPPIETREIFTGKDYLLAESVKYDLEGEMVKNVRELISYEMGRWDGRDKKELMHSLQNGSELLIKNAFEGFRTYNRLKKE